MNTPAALLNESNLPENEKKRIVNQLLINSFQSFMNVFYNLGYKQKILGRWTNEGTGETFEIEFKKVDPINEFGL